MRTCLMTLGLMFMLASPSLVCAAGKEPVKMTGKEILQLTTGTRVDLKSPELAAQLLAIDKEIKDGIIYSELSGADLKYIKATLKSFSEWSSQNAPSADAVTPDMLKSEQKVNELLTKAQKDSVLVCRAEMLPASHLVKRRCMTVAQAERLRERTMENFLRRSENKVDAPINGAPHGGGP